MLIKLRRCVPKFPEDSLIFFVSQCAVDIFHLYISDSGKHESTIEEEIP